jgi:hypothetical protein
MTEETNEIGGFEIVVRIFTMNGYISQYNCILWVIQ